MDPSENCATTFPAVALVRAAFSALSTSGANCAADAAGNAPAAIATTVPRHHLRMAPSVSPPAGSVGRIRVRMKHPPRVSWRAAGLAVCLVMPAAAPGLAARPQAPVEPAVIYVPTP